MYCPACREPGRLPWQHAADCVEGLRHRLRWYEAGLPIVALLLLGEAALLLGAWVALGRCR
jgi:hypothetical protein